MWECGGLAVALLIGSSDEQWMVARNREARGVDEDQPPRAEAARGGTRHKGGSGRMRWLCVAVSSKTVILMSSITTVRRFGMAQTPLRLNDGENIIRGSAPTLEGVYRKAGFVLTNERVIQVVKAGLSSRSLHSIGLDKIDSVFAKVRSNLGAIIFGLILLAGGAYSWSRETSQMPEAGTIGKLLVGIGAFMFIIAILTRKKSIEIVSGSAKMVLDLTRVGFRDANSLVAEIEQAKVRREVSLRAGVGAAAVPKTGSASAEERLSQLRDLHSKGIISQSEYDTKREQLIATL